MIPGVMETRGYSRELTADNIDEVPVRAVRFIVGVGEINGYPERNLGASYPAQHIRMLRNHGKLPLTTLDTADWSATPMNDWLEAVRRLVEYVPSTLVEVGNEPGLRSGGRESDWPAYWVRLKRATEIIHAAGKKAILGAMPPGYSQAFIREADENDALKWVDGVGIHPYMPTPMQQTKWLWDRRRQLDDAGFTGPLYFSEFGWGSDGEPSPMMVGPEAQADYLSKAFRNFAGPGLRVEVACWFSWSNWDRGNDWVHNAGVVTHAGSRKPAYYALEQVA